MKITKDKRSERMRERNLTHGASHTRLYRIWAGIIKRCTKNLKNYGARGIQVCDEWRRFESFQAWALANGYDDTLTIERNNVDGHYEPTNCLWIPGNRQQANRRSVSKAPDGTPWCDIAKAHGISNPLKNWRLKAGWDPYMAATFPPGVRNTQRERDAKGKWK